MRLCDVLDDELTEQMLLQHGRYEFGRYVVARHDSDGLWYCYYRGTEMHCHQNPGKVGASGFRDLANAIEFALSPRQQELCEEADNRKER